MAWISNANAARTSRIAAIMRVSIAPMVGVAIHGGTVCSSCTEGERDPRRLPTEPRRQPQRHSAALSREDGGRTPHRRHLNRALGWVVSRFSGL